MPPERFADWTYHPDLLARPVPRYTSYPTAAEFADGAFEAPQRAALRALRGPVSLYLHIPYCAEICWYCGCNTGAANRRRRLDGYLEALVREIEEVGGLLHPSVRVVHVAFGGGSPNAIAPTDFVRLIDALVLCFRHQAPVLSVELDPRTLAPAWLTAIRGIGVTRASLGVQTFDPAVQAAIGRVQPRAMIAAAVSGLRAAGVRSLNFDLMYGLPGQDADALAATIAESVALGADRVALFGYAHLPQAIPRQRRIDAAALPDQRARFAMAAMGRRQLVEAGYVPVGFDHFALPGDGLARAVQDGSLRRNFQGFTDDGSPALIGLGASAVSAFHDLFVQNEKNPGRYRMLVEAGRLAGRRGVARTPDDRRRGAVIEDLLCQGTAFVDAELLAATLPALDPFVACGLLRVEGNRLRLLPGSEPYARSVAAAFDAYRAGGPQFSSAV